MLRTVVLLLLIANLVFYAWTQGWLGAVPGADPRGEHEPQRLQAQIRAQTIRVLAPPGGPATPALPESAAPAPAPAAAASSPAEAASVNAGAATAAAGPVQQGVVCLEAGPFASADVPRLEAALREALPNGTWALQPLPRPGQWIAYLGRFNDRDALRARADELRDQNVRFEELRGTPELEPGISLGRFEREAEARDELRRLNQRGVRGGRVVSVSSNSAPTYRLRIEQADGLLMAMTLRLKDRLQGRALALCPA